MGQSAIKGSSPAAGHPGSPDAAAAGASAAGSLSQVLGLVESPGDGPEGVRLQQHRRGEGLAQTWQLEVLRQTKTIHKWVDLQWSR